VTASGIELVVTDLDGTIWPASGVMHPDTVAALAELRARGVTVLAATARRPWSTFETLRSNGVDLPAVCFDGALGRGSEDGPTFVRRPFEPDAAAAVLAAFRAAGLEPSCNIDHPTHDFVVGEWPSTHPGNLDVNAARLQRRDLAEAVATEVVLSFTLAGVPRAALERVLDPLGDGSTRVADGSVTPDHAYGEHFITVRPLGVSKWTGVLAFCAHRGLDPARVLAIGDGGNDVEMLAAAAIACAPADACDEALARADHVVGTAAEGGWAGVVELVG
jgi:hydroxymethylpyrimidine pyrophosphatase-like HAD family hydrolase